MKYPNERIHKLKLHSKLILKTKKIVKLIFPAEWLWYKRTSTDDSLGSPFDTIFCNEHIIT